MQIKKVIFLTAGIFASSFQVMQAYSVQNENLVNMQEVLNTLVQQWGISGQFTGVPVTVQCPAYTHGKATTFNAGLQSKQGNPMNDESLFQIGSNTKSFVSVVLLQLEAENKLTIENKVDDFFPGEYPKWGDVTIRQLLNMTSGIPDYVHESNVIIDKVKQNPYYVLTNDDLLNSVKDADLDFTPGTGWSYSNTNYVLVAKIIEKITGRDISEEIKNRIIDPLHLHHTFYISTFPKADVPKWELSHLMSGYFNVANDPPNVFPSGQDIIDYSTSWANAAGSITATTADLNKYGRALFSKNSHGLLPKKQFDELITLVDTTTGTPLPGGVDSEHSDAYGLGLSADYSPVLNSVYYGHSGVTLGFVSEWGYFPAQGISYVYALNTSAGGDYLNAGFIDPLNNFLSQNCTAARASANTDMR